MDKNWKQNHKILSEALRVGGSPSPDEDARYWMPKTEFTPDVIVCGNWIFDRKTQRWSDDK